jgi:hypothetical protein
VRTLVIESCPTLTRWCIEDGKAPQLAQSFRLWGRRHGKHGKWLWTDGSERLSAFEDETISVESLWKRLLDADKTERHEDAQLLIAATFSEITIEGHLDRVVFIIPESLPETSQNALITALSLRARVSQRETYLLWRSVALALSEDSRENDESSRVILDYGHFASEFSTLKLTESQGYRCPVRDFTSHRAKGLPHDHALNAWIHKNYTCSEKTTAKALQNFHPHAYSYLQNDLNFDPPAAWECVSGRYEERKVAHYDFAEPVPWDRIIENVQDFIDAAPVRKNGKILWHGWPAYWHGEHAIKHHHEASELTEPEAMLRGGIEFAKRHRLRRPTYFELIPGYRIWCQVTELGLPREWRWEELIPKNQIAGTEIYQAKPIERFQLNPGTLSFDMNIREGQSPMYRFVEQTLPVPITAETPIVINSEIRPTGGGVKFSLKAKNDPDLFGQNAEVALRWDRAKQEPVEKLRPPEQEETTYAHPFIITSTGSPEKREELISLANTFLQGDRSYPFLKRLDSLLVPSLRNGYEVPFGNRPIEGGLPEVLQNFVDKLNDESHWHIRNLKGKDANSSKILRLTGALFHYASEETQRHLADEAIRSDFPLNSAKASSLYWANGRTIRDAQELERYLIKTTSAWPELDGMHYWLFWPFAKSLCQYGNGAKISRKMAFIVFQYASQMLDWLINKNVPTAPGAFGRPNWKKWTLAALLYGLRVREVIPDFLSLEDGPTQEVELATRLKEQLSEPEILLTKIPDLALKGIDTGGQQPRLGDLVRRFLEARASKEDLKLAGGIGLSS